MSGHVFVVHGDLTRLHADAYAISGRPDSGPSRTWNAHLGARLGGAENTAPVGDGEREIRRWAWRDGSPGPWVVPVAGDENTPFEWYEQAIRAFAGIARRHLAHSVGPRPLVAVPNLGGDKGGQAHDLGQHIPKMLGLLQELAREHDVDVAYVFLSRRGYEAAQVHRMRERDRWWPALGDDLDARAQQLARRAVRGELALFLGAGIGNSAQLPDWGKLLASLEHELEKSTAVTLPPGLGKLDYLDRAHFLERAFKGTGKSLAERVAERIRAQERYGLSHALLAALPVQEVVTTNYDDLFERAAAAQSKAFRVIPYEGRTEGEPWLMKLHGCVNHPEDIVLTRASFSGFESKRGALAGTLGGLLMTRHVLFAGTSLGDANVLRIVDAVQRALDEDGGSTPMGTNLALETVEKSAAQQRLWEGVLDWASFPDANVLSVFLDRLAAAACAGMSFLLADEFAAINGHEAELKSAIEHLMTIQPRIGNDAMRTVVAEFLEKFRSGAGEPGESRRPPS